MSGSLAMWALGVIQLQTQQLKMLLLETARLLILFSDLKSRANKYILELWQSEWDELPGNKLHEIFPVLKQCVVCPRTNRREETVTARLHIGHSFITHSFLLKGDEPPMCIGCDELLNICYLFRFD